MIDHYDTRDRAGCGAFQKWSIKKGVEQAQAQVHCQGTRYKQGITQPRYHKNRVAASLCTIQKAV